MKTSCLSQFLLTTLLAASSFAQDPIAESLEPNSYPLFTNLACGQQAEGVIGSAVDVDYWRIQCPGPMSLRAFVGPGLTLPRISDCVLELRDSGNTLLSSNDDGAGIGLYSDIRDFRIPAAGTYFLAVRGYLAFTGSYSLDVACGPAGLSWTSAIESPEPNQTNGTATTSTCANRFEGAIGFAGDVDRYSVTVTAGQAMTISTGSGNSGSAVSDTTLTLRSASGLVLAANDDSLGLYARINYTFPSAGVYFVDIAGYLNQVVGTYSMELDCSGIQPVPASVTMFDIGCRSSAGEIPRFQRRTSPSGLTYVERPIIGTNYVADIAMCPPNSVLLVAVGFQTQPQAVPIPGAPGCNALVVPAWGDLRFANAAGSASWVLPVPYDQYFVGVVLQCQVLVFDPTANALGAVVSNRLQSVIGNSF